MDRTDPCDTRDTWTWEGQGGARSAQESPSFAFAQLPGGRWAWATLRVAILGKDYHHPPPADRDRDPHPRTPCSALLQAAQQKFAAEVKGPWTRRGRLPCPHGRGLARAPGRDCEHRLPRSGGLTRLRCERCRYA